MNVPVCTVYLQILVIFSLLVGIMLYREPPTPLGDGDGRAVARGAGPQDGAAAWQRPAFGGVLDKIARETAWVELVVQGVEGGRSSTLSSPPISPSKPLLSPS
jgi:hypothetical protein